MSEKYTREDHENYRREVAEREKRESQERRERSAKDAARLKWVGDGGSEAAFERQWPEIRDEMRRRRVIDADERARLAQQVRGISTI